MLKCILIWIPPTQLSVSPVKYNSQTNPLTSQGTVIVETRLNLLINNVFKMSLRAAVKRVSVNKEKSPV